MPFPTTESDFAALRGIRDEFMREHNSDYFQNSRHATFVQQELPSATR
ncbi:hypothetical protein OVA00_33670 [Ensifer sp. SL37]|nr:hypothetical protein [Ensifer sp. SL37]